MGRFVEILLAVTGTVALQVMAQAVLLANVRFIDRRTRGRNGDIVLAPGYRIFGALGATCGSLMLGWSTALIFAAISPAIERGRG